MIGLRAHGEVRLCRVFARGFFLWLLFFVGGRRFAFLFLFLLFVALSLVCIVDLIQPPGPSA